MTKKALNTNKLLCDNNTAKCWLPMTQAFFEIHIKELFFYERSFLENQNFFEKSDQLTWWVLRVLLSHNNLFVSKAFIVIGDVYLALFAMRSL